MNVTTYHVLCRYAGSHLWWSHPWPLPAAVPFGLQAGSAVYIVEDASGNCRYVGSVCRGVGGLAARIAEHLTDPIKCELWHRVWVLPLRPETPEVEVRRIEGVVGAHLPRLGSQRLPRARPAPKRNALHQAVRP